MKVNDMKSDVITIAASRRGVLDKYLSGEVAQQAQKQPFNEQVIALQKGCGKRPFFYLHGDWTGNAFYCFSLAEYVGKDQPFFVLEPYSFDTMLDLPSLEKIAATQLKAIRDVQPTGPYMLGGFCNGALVAYEMARQLRHDGHAVDLLVLVDAIPARLRLLCGLIKWLGALLRVEQEWQLTCFLRIQHIFRYLCDKGAEDFVYLRTIDSRVDALFPPLESLLKEYPAMFTWATSQYKPPFYNGKVTLFWDEVEPVRRIWWRRMAHKKDKDMEVHILPGTHYTCKTIHPHGLAEHLRMCLSLVQQGPS
jgi:pimeloyl-ACP methyl ester carboxylesterase